MNAGKHYIGKTAKKTLNTAAAVAVALCFFVTSLLCCCLPGKAHAEIQSAFFAKSESLHAHCCSSVNHKAHSESKKSCDCAQMSRGAADLSFKLFDFKLSFNQFSKISTVVQSFFHDNFVPALALAYNGPPGFRKSIPIYLQTSNLRL